MGHFTDKVVVVTGGASGIGRALCEEMAKQRSIVIAADINLDQAEQTIQLVEAAGGRGRALRLDVTDPDAVNDLVRLVADEYGRLDFMFNNAGITIGGEVRFMEMEQIRRIIDINYMGVLYGSIAAYQIMLQQGFGHIINTASLCGLVPTPLQAIYASTKHAVVGLSTSLREEGVDLGVKVSVICPGLIKTNLVDNCQVMGGTMDDLMNAAPLMIMDVKKAARYILKDVARNKTFIVCPLDARNAWRFYRLSPSFISFLSKRAVRRFRNKQTMPINAMIKAVIKNKNEINKGKAASSD